MPTTASCSSASGRMSCCCVLSSRAPPRSARWWPASGAHIVTEKPMTVSLADADRLMRATRAANVRLMTNWPSAWSGAIRRMQQLVETGEIGTLLQVHTRMGSGGPYYTGAAHPGVRELVTRLDGSREGRHLVVRRLARRRRLSGLLLLRGGARLLVLRPAAGRPLRAYGSTWPARTAPPTTTAF